MRKLMRRLTVAAVLGVAAGVGGAPNTVLAEQPASSQTAQEYYYTVVGGSAKEPSRIRPWSEPFDTEAAAQARLNSILRDHRMGGLLEFDADSPRGLNILKEPKAPKPAKDADDKEPKKSNLVKDVDDAAQRAKKLLTGLEHQVGDTLKEYTNRIAVAYENATKAKAGMTALTGKIARQQFEDVNKQIDGFNGLRTEASQKVGVAGDSLMARYPTMSRVTPQDLKGKLEDSPPATQSASLAGKRGSGKFGQSTIDVEFQEGGKVIFRDPDSNNEVLNEGTWSQTGDEVAMNTKRFSYTGKIAKDGVEGSRTEGQGNKESWRLSFGPKQVSSISGTSWRRQGSIGIGYYSGLYFNADKTVRVSVYPDGRKSFKWSETGGNISIIEDDGVVRQVTRNGNSLTTEFGRGTAYFTRN